MTKIKIALCQMNVVDNKEENLKNAALMIEDSVDENADFIVLPEMLFLVFSPSITSLITGFSLLFPG